MLGEEENSLLIPRKLGVPTDEFRVLHATVGARLQSFWQVWEAKGAEPWVINVLREGYTIPFSESPPLKSSPVDFNVSSRDSEKLVVLEEEVTSLLQKGAIEAVLEPSSPGFYNRLFLVPKSSGGWRPVLDVSALNKFVLQTPFKMETTQSVINSLKEGDWMVSLDLQDAYFHVPIHPRSRKFLRFVFRGRAFQFRALCFGLSTAPQVFTRTMAPIAKWLHLEGIHISLYLDDWLIRSPSKGQCMKDLQRTLSLTDELGLIVNLPKSQLSPSQDLTYLGVRMNSVLFQVFPTSQRIEKCLLKVRYLMAAKTCSAKEWMSLLGTLSSLEMFVSLGRLHMRPLQFFLQQIWNRKKDTDSFVFPLSTQVKQDLSWWNDRSKLDRGLSLRQRNPDLMLFSDASDEGWGATLGDLQVSGNWSSSQRDWHINAKELKAIHLALEHFVLLVENKKIVVHSDNSTALAYVKKQGGTHSFSLFEIAKDLLLWAATKNIELVTRFIPGALNVRADILSRSLQVIPTEWTLHQKVCQGLWKVWGTPMLDLFATRENRRLPLFCSPVPDPEALAVDAMLLDWSGLFLYAFPPFRMLGEVLKKFRAHKGVSMILIAPWWPGRSWFPELLEKVVDWPRRLPFRPDLLCQLHSRKFHRNPSDLNLTGFRLSSDSTGGEASLEEWRRQWLDQPGPRLQRSIKRSGSASGSGAPSLECLPLLRL